MNKNHIPLSMLDLVPIGEGFSPGDAIAQGTRLAQAAEAAGYLRYWVAEHHSMVDIASAATAVVLSHIGAHTQHIRLGSGGIMLPNHAPLVVAEQFGTLEAMYPGRIDLGLGRAPGSDGETMRALRRDVRADGSEFPDLLEELQHYLAPAADGQRVRAVPGSGQDVPVWLLGSSTYSAQLAAFKGLPFAFAAHFAPDAMQMALDLYHRNFRPSAQLSAPYAMVCINAAAADTQEEAEFLFSSALQKFLSMGRGGRNLLAPPVRDMASQWSPAEEFRVREQLREALCGTPDQVCAGLEALVERTGVEELMISSWIHDPAARIHSHELIAQAWL
jgi:luciferase family oxidoreductase group 1